MRIVHKNTILGECGTSLDADDRILMRFRIRRTKGADSGDLATYMYESMPSGVGQVFSVAPLQGCAVSSLRREIDPDRGYRRNLVLLLFSAYQRGHETLKYGII